jgi:hypothetical protein
MHAQKRRRFCFCCSAEEQQRSYPRTTLLFRGYGQAIKAPKEEIYLAGEKSHAGSLLLKCLPCQTSDAVAFHLFYLMRHEWIF